MNKNTYVFSILLSVAFQASLNAAVAEEYNNVGALNEEQVADYVQTEVKEVLPTPTVASQIIEEKQTTQIAYAPASSSKADAYLEAEVEKKSSEHSLAITPMVGATVFSGTDLGTYNIRNQYSLGMGLELPVSPYFAFEIEGNYANSRYGYTPNAIPGVPNFIKMETMHQWSVGANSKVYLTRSRLRPWVGAGLAAVGFSMTSLVPGPIAGNPIRAPYNPVLGSANLMAGLDLDLSDSIAIGGRAGWMIPIVNRQFVVNNGITAAPGFEEASFVNRDYYRFLVTTSIKL